MPELIRFPESSVSITRFDMGLRYPGQVTHVSPYSGSVQTLNRSGGIWHGVMEFDLAEPGNPGERGISASAARVRWWLAALNGTGNYTQLPVQAALDERVIGTDRAGPETPHGNRLWVAGADRARGRITVAQTLQGAALTPPALRDWLTARSFPNYLQIDGGRVFEFQSMTGATAAATLQLLPAPRIAPLASPPTIAVHFSSTPLILARRDGDGDFLTSRTPDFLGPWTFNWVEHFDANALVNFTP